jgi:hypothetical protein
MRLRGITQVSLIVVFSVSLAGCATPVIGAMTLGTFSTIVDGVVSFLSGKSLEEHALSFITGKDCNLTESILRKDRKFCEERDSLATRDDFHGILANFGPSDSDLLDRYGRARQQELAEAGEARPAAVTQANLISLPMYSGVPARGDKPGYAKIGNIVVYIMAPIYDMADLFSAKRTHHAAEDKPAPQPGAPAMPVAVAPAN